MKLIGKLVIGIISGIIIGLIAPHKLVRVIVTFKEIFGQFLGFTIPLIIIFFIASGIASFGKQSGKMLGLTGGLAYVSSVIPGTLAFIVAIFIIPSLVGNGRGSTEEPAGFEPLFELTIEPITGVMPALVLSFVFGIGITRIKSPTLRSFFDEGKAIVKKLIWKIIIPILPFYIASIFAELAADGSVFKTLQTFGLVLVMAIVMHWVWLIILYVIAGSFTGRNPFTALKT